VLAATSTSCRAPDRLAERDVRFPLASPIDRRHTREMNNGTFVLRPISPSEADALRRRGGPVYVADESPGYPCRQCLEDAAVGDELILVSHDPFTANSPYRSASPIFLHRAPCQPYVSDDVLPEQLTRRQLSVRCFDRDEMMIDAAVIDGADLELTIERFFSNPAAHDIHVHNSTRGCWAVVVDRASAD
jgi:hypothetical protein